MVREPVGGWDEQHPGDDQGQRGSGGPLPATGYLTADRSCDMT